MALVLTEYRAQATKAGVDPTQAHMRDLRRTLGSWQAATGASLPIIGRSLGHKQVQTTAIYARLSLDPVRAAVEKAATAMLEAVGEGTEPTKPTAAAPTSQIPTSQQ
jgi:integrase